MSKKNKDQQVNQGDTGNSKTRLGQTRTKISKKTKIISVVQRKDVDNYTNDIAHKIQCT